MLPLLPFVVTFAAVSLVWIMGLFRKPRSFAGKHVLVTGGSTGIGQAAAELLAKQGAHVSLVARSQPKLDAAKAQIEAALDGGSIARVDTFSADVTNAADVSIDVQGPCSPSDLAKWIVINASIGTCRCSG